MAIAKSVLSRWWWMWLTHGFFVYAMCKFFYFKQDVWSTKVYRAIGLSFEMNYAVWWSGICLFFASLIYFRIGQIDTQVRRSWNILGLVALALCLDEIGSLHETVAEYGGWIGLLPFAVILGVGFLYSVHSLTKIPHSRLPAFLIFTGAVIFGAVAGLEYIEHNVEHGPDYQKLRLIVEEAMELFGMSLLVTGGLIAYLRNPRISQNSNSLKLTNISIVLNSIFSNSIAMFLLFAIQISVTVAFIIPNFTLFPFGIGEGNLSALYPVLLFLSMGLVCLNFSFNKGDYVLGILGYIFAFTSIFQLYNFIEFTNALFKLNWETLLVPPTSWYTTLVPWAAIVGLNLLRGACSVWKILGHLLILFIVSIFLIPGIEELQVIDSYYFVFSSFVGYSCYQFLYNLKFQNPN